MAFLTLAAAKVGPASPFVPTKLEMECTRRVCGKTDAEFADRILPEARKRNLDKLKKATPLREGTN